MDLEKILKGTKKDQIKDNIIIFSIFFTVLIGGTIFSWISWSTIFWILCCLFMFIMIIKDKIRIKKKTIYLLNNLPKKELSAINKELQQQINIHVRGHYALTNSYIIDLVEKTIIKYNNIILIYYDSKYEGGGREVGGKFFYLMVITKDRIKHKFLINTSHINFGNKLVDFSYVIKEKNPSVLEDKTPENIKIIKEKYNFDLSKIKKK